jgi:hypothetical protein
MNDWGYAQVHPTEQLARLHFFSMMKKTEAGGEVEFHITVKEFAMPRDGAMVFFAQADKQTNQKAAPYTPSGWGKTLLGALQECVREIHRFPYQAEDARAAQA